ncbi:hypothetical protein TNIN_253991 [Trichonephila inaurata madagascariensis]|uniref:Uncharacterized protein n=1 Tax=Trichonephila inaurata madagascariensis TaxID=2747483 RepID=A0A8X7CE17_9ARAC|nr:hypothetical protein TNIN_253991 [Trichonephila inaurata madagascariensis]
MKDTIVDHHRKGLKANQNMAIHALYYSKPDGKKHWAKKRGNRICNRKRLSKILINSLIPPVLPSVMHETRSIAWCDLASNRSVIGNCLQFSAPRVNYNLLLSPEDFARWCKRNKS